MDENMGNFISLTDEEGFEVNFEIADEIIYDGREFLILLPDTEEEEVEVTILEVKQDGDNERFVSVSDPELLMALFEIFEAKFEGQIEFVD